jgi:hypothetical protein
MKFMHKVCIKLPKANYKYTMFNSITVCIFFLILGAAISTLKAQRAFQPPSESAFEMAFAASSPHFSLSPSPPPRERSLTFEQRRNQKALGCLGLVAGALMKIQSRSIYNDYLGETDEAQMQSLYNQANALHKASLVSMALGSVVFVIPLRRP